MLGSESIKSLPSANRLKTHCNSGHPLSGANLKIDSRGARVCNACRLASRARFLNQQRETSRAARKAGVVRYGYTRNVVKLIPRETLEEAFAAVRETGKIIAGAPIVGEWKWRALNHFDKKIHAAMKKLARPQLRVVSAPAISFARPDCGARLLDIVNAAVPRGLPRDMRDDVISEMTLALIEGRLLRRDVANRAGEFVRSSFKSDHNRFGPWSLDMPAFREGATPLVETITQGLWQ